MQSLCTLRTPRCRDARNTRYRAARYALPGRDLHPLDRASFAWRTVWRPHKGIRMAVETVKRYDPTKRLGFIEPQDGGTTSSSISPPLKRLA
jgi:hypothetical protein